MSLQEGGQRPDLVSEFALPRWRGHGGDSGGSAGLRLGSAETKRGEDCSSPLRAVEGGRLLLDPWFSAAGACLGSERTDGRGEPGGGDSRPR